MAPKKRGLGKGLGALFGDDTETRRELPENNTEKESSGSEPEKKTSGKPSGQKKPAVKKSSTKKTAAEAKSEEADTAEQTGEILIRLSQIETNEKQPRKNFDEEELEELTASIRQFGVLQPLLVQKSGKKYRIIAGERRFRAAKEAGLKEVPVIIRDYSGQQAAEVAIIENVQRADLNPMEEAMAYQTLIDEYGLRQEDIADRVSKNRTTITNALRLLKLSEEVREMVAQGILSAGHARTLVVVEDPEEQLALAKEIAEKGLSVRDTERLIKLRGRKKAKPEDPEKTADDPLKIFYRDYEEQMHTLLGTKVRINRRDKNKGRIEIDYYSQDELERLMDLFRSVGHE